MPSEVEKIYFHVLPHPFDWSARFNYHGEKAPDFHEHVAFQFIGALKGVFYADFPRGKTCALREGEAILIAPGTPHIWRSPKNAACKAMAFLCGA